MKLEYDYKKEEYNITITSNDIQIALKKHDETKKDVKDILIKEINDLFQCGEHFKMILMRKGGKHD